MGVTNPDPSLSAEAEISDVCRRSNDVRQVQIRLTPRSGACMSAAGSETGMLCNSVVVDQQDQDFGARKGFGLRAV